MKNVLKLLTLILVVGVFAGNGDNSHAQTPHSLSGKLIYRRHLVNGEREIVSLTENTRIAVPLGAEQCYAVSRDNALIVTWEPLGYLTIRSLSDGEVVLEFPLSEEQTPAEGTRCSMTWNSDNVSLDIFVERELTPANAPTIWHDTFFTIDIATAQLTGPYTETYVFDCDRWLRADRPEAAAADPDCEAIRARLPDIWPEEAFIQRSPNPDIFLYQRYLPELENPDDRFSAVLYDIVRGQTIEALIEPPPLGPPYGARRLAWSPSGRYLAYLNSFRFPQVLTIYDLAERQYLPQITIDDQLGTLVPDLTWSPDESRVTFVVWPDGPREYTPNVVPDYLLVVFDRITGDLHISEQVHRLQTGTPPSSLWWSPDSETLAYVGFETDLLRHFNPMTGEIVTLDDQVYRILDWVPTE